MADTWGHEVGISTLFQWELKSDLAEGPQAVHGARTHPTLGLKFSWRFPNRVVYSGLGLP
jgi:hypothetical protein